MYRLTARVLLVFLLAGIFVPVAMAFSAPELYACCARKPMQEAASHACCMRKPMYTRGSRNRDIEAVGCQNQNCCPALTTAHWAELGSGVDSNTHPLLAYLLPDAHPILHSGRAVPLRPVRGPPLS